VGTGGVRPRDARPPGRAYPPRNRPRAARAPVPVHHRRSAPRL